MDLGYNGQNRLINFYFGVTIGKVLEKWAGAFVIASKNFKKLLELNPFIWPMLLTGYILSIPVFLRHSALLIMNPLNKVNSHIKAGVSFARYHAALALGF